MTKNQKDSKVQKCWRHKSSKPVTDFVACQRSSGSSKYIHEQICEITFSK